MVSDITKIMHTPFFVHQISLVFVYLTCGPRQLFFQCGPEMPKGWTPLISWLLMWCGTDCYNLFGEFLIIGFSKLFPTYIVTKCFLLSVFIHKSCAFNCWISLGWISRSIPRWNSKHILKLLYLLLNCSLEIIYQYIVPPIEWVIVFIPYYSFLLIFDILTIENAITWSL